MRRVIGPAIGALMSTPKGSGIACAAGEIGVLAARESERRHPARRSRRPATPQGSIRVP